MGRASWLSPLVLALARPLMAQQAVSVGRRALFQFETSLTAPRFAGPRRRWASLAVLLLHVPVVGLAPLADARVEAAATAGAPHFESERSDSCPPAHDELLCQLCQQMGPRLSSPCGWGRLRTEQRILTTDLFLTHAAPHRALDASPLGSRAPPIA